VGRGGARIEAEEEKKKENKRRKRKRPEEFDSLVSSKPPCRNTRC